jgi:hypothetical protein
MMQREPKPCSKLRDADIVRWVAHLNRGKCKQYLRLFRYFERESQKHRLLWAHRN